MAGTKRTRNTDNDVDHPTGNTPPPTRKRGRPRKNQQAARPQTPPSPPRRMTYMPFEEVPEGWNLARGGWPEADDFFYTKSFKDSNWTQKKLLVGFNITHAHLHALRMDIVGFLKDGKLYDKHFGTKEMDLKFDPMYKAAEAKYDLLRNDDIPRCWRSQALEGFRAMVRKETRPNPDMLDESSPEGRRMVLAPGAVS